MRARLDGERVVVCGRCVGVVQPVGQEAEAVDAVVVSASVCLGEVQAAVAELLERGDERARVADEHGAGAVGDELAALRESPRQHDDGCGQDAEDDAAAEDGDGDERDESDHGRHREQRAGDERGSEQVEDEREEDPDEEVRAVGVHDAAVVADERREEARERHHGRVAVLDVREFVREHGVEFGVRERVEEALGDDDGRVRHAADREAVRDAAVGDAEVRGLHVRLLAEAREPRVEVGVGLSRGVGRGDVREELALREAQLRPHEQDEDGDEHDQPASQECGLGADDAGERVVDDREPGVREECEDADDDGVDREDQGEREEDASHEGPVAFHAVRRGNEVPNQKGFRPDTRSRYLPWTPSMYQR